MDFIDSIINEVLMESLNKNEYSSSFDNEYYFSGIPSDTHPITKQ